MRPELPPWVLLIPLVALPFMYVVVAYMISNMGWSTLAARFRTDTPPPEGARRMQWGSFGGFGSYNNVLTVGYSDAGLYLGVLILFRAFHPPLLIPWSAIRSRTRARYFLVMCDTLEITADSTVSLRLRTSVTDSFVRYLPAAR
jgi:hypothetical protein